MMIVMMVSSLLRVQHEDHDSEKTFSSRRQDGDGDDDEARGRVRVRAGGGNRIVQCREAEAEPSAPGPT